MKEKVKKERMNEWMKNVIDVEKQERCQVKNEKKIYIEN